MQFGFIWYDLICKRICLLDLIWTALVVLLVAWKFATYLIVVSQLLTTPYLQLFCFVFLNWIYLLLRFFLFLFKQICSTWRLVWHLNVFFYPLRSIKMSHLFLVSLCLLLSLHAKAIRFRLYFVLKRNCFFVDINQFFAFNCILQFSENRCFESISTYKLRFCLAVVIYFISHRIISICKCPTN